jgi:hypothetical protein
MSTPTPWVKSSRSGSSGNCVEMRRTADAVVEVRDTKDRGTGPILRFTPDQFAAWLDGARSGALDHLV